METTVYGTTEESSEFEIDPIIPLHCQIPEPMAWIENSIDELYDVARYFHSQGKNDSAKFITDAAGKLTMLAHGYAALLEHNHKLVMKNGNV